ncbi:MAG: cytochrome d ubiquinol oxidase subunit II, partial [Alloprevotella sp.]|nr:cytochrome d ubiquinol oxidase subunit II [Alloprevotella sp.]
AASGGAEGGLVISRWANAWHGLDALANPWNWVLGFAVFFLARTLGILYVMNNVEEENLRSRGSVRLIGTAGLFVLFFLAFLFHVLTKEGFAVAADGTVSMEPYKYLHNLLDMWYVAIAFVLGVALVLYGIIRTIISKTYVGGIWPAGVGTVLTVTALLLLAAWNGTAYYPSTADLQSSLTLQNSCSSEFTLRTMAWVSLIIPFVLAYIFFAWRAIDKKKLTKEELRTDDHKY